MVQEIFDWRDSMRNTPGKSNSSIQVLKAFFSWAQKRRNIRHSPAQPVPLLKITGRKDRIWTPEQLEGFCDAAKPKVREIFLAALFTGQRSGDVRNMQWSDYDGEWLHVKQGKTGAEVNLPVYKL